VCRQQVYSNPATYIKEELQRVRQELREEQSSKGSRRWLQMA
jgi:hypothetical protein